MTRDEAIDDLKTLKDFFIGKSNATPLCLDYAIDALERRYGKWIRRPISVMGEGYVWYCSECDCERFYGFNKPLYNYCPDCGADMRGERHD